MTDMTPMAQQRIDAWLERDAPDVQGGRPGVGTEVAS